MLYLSVILTGIRQNTSEQLHLIIKVRKTILKPVTVESVCLEHYKCSLRLQNQYIKNKYRPARER